MGDQRGPADLTNSGGVPLRREVLTRLLAQPLAQFVLIGALVFGAYSLVSGDEAAAPTEIRVGATELRWLSDTWRGQLGRPPTAIEMRAAVKAYVDEEMRYREGLALGLDRDDTIVRRRLAQKYDFMLGAEAVEAIPTEAQLRAHFEREGQTYTAPMLASFCQVYFGAGAGGLARAGGAVAALSPSAAADAGSIAAGSDRLPYPRCYDRASPDDIRRDFGKFFAGTLDRLPMGAWQGPVESGYGFHAVFVGARKPGRRLSFAEARSRVEADWRRQAAREARLRQDRDLRERYHVTVDERALAALNRAAAR